jgi:hypothetical protein
VTLEERLKEIELKYKPERLLVCSHPNCNNSLEGNQKHTKCCSKKCSDAVRHIRRQAIKMANRIEIKRFCMDCNCDISTRVKNTKRCHDCAVKITKKKQANRIAVRRATDPEFREMCRARDKTRVWTEEQRKQRQLRASEYCSKRWRTDPEYRNRRKKAHAEWMEKNREKRQKLQMLNKQFVPNDWRYAINARTKKIYDALEAKEDK